LHFTITSLLWLYRLCLHDALPIFAWDRFWGWDPKEVWALITWFFYAAFLHLRLSRGWHGEKSSWLAVIGFAIIMFNLIVVNLVIDRKSTRLNSSHVSISYAVFCLK